MKIIRFLSEDDLAYYGIPSEKEGYALKIKGGLFSGFEISNDLIRIKKILPPLMPINILCIGLNYKKHIDEQNAKKPDYPVLFLKTNNTVIGSHDDIILPAIGPDFVDYEAELAVIIAKKAKNILPEEAEDIIFGYTCANDVSARDWQKHKQGRQWCKGKSFDTFCPIGPCIITKEEIGDPQNLNIRCYLNNNLMQDSNTKDMLWNVYELISFLSQGNTLYPGTLILTGTPEGVGFARTPPVFLEDGDTVIVEIEKIGKLYNRIIREK